MSFLNEVILSMTMEGSNPFVTMGLRSKFPSAINIDEVDKTTAKLHYPESVTLSLHGMFVNVDPRTKTPNGLNKNLVGVITSNLDKVDHIQSTLHKEDLNERVLAKGVKDAENLSYLSEQFISTRTMASPTSYVEVTVTKGQFIEWVTIMHKVYGTWLKGKVSKNIDSGIYDPEINANHPVNKWPDGAAVDSYDAIVSAKNRMVDYLDDISTHIYRIVEI